ncbi:nucleotidyltransferase domain-containing protein [Butyrivibrio sp. VCB2006]|uniref:nucleotidyltransferase domain-containing protein n=1 Tax=Butyrivibrio sp. VCB2006 TaxID=1280679 RepID=UPI000414AF84|nr:nucleotidyltransferase family protein [Butyrivibrio sp. VCB2006]
MADHIAIRKYSRELILATFEKREPYAIPEGMTIEDVFDIGIKGQMQYLIMNSMLKISEGTEEYQFIKGTLAQSTFRTFVQMMSAREITKAFEENGIRHQILKGAVTKTIYPSPEMREMSDIDLVVYDESLDKAAEVMEKLGFKNNGLIKHHMIFTKDPGVLVEVHWTLFDQNADKAQHLYFKDLRANLAVGKKYTYEFSKEDFYVYMIAHMAKHFFETGCGIRNLLDIYIYIGKYGDELDEAYLEKELSKCGILDFEKNMRELAFIWMEDRDCSQFYENLFAYMVDSGIYGKTENGVWSQLAKETADCNNSIKLHYYFPSMKFMVEKYKWLEKAPFLLPLAWIIRGVSGVCNKKSRDHRKQIENADDEKVKVMLDMYHRLNLNFRR